VSDWFYQTVVLLGRFPFWVSSRPVVLHAERARREGAFILAANHTSPYDIPALMRHTPRRLDFVSIVEVFRNPLVGWFYSHMNAFPLHRGRNDAKAVRVILDRLSRGRVIGMFPEGRICPPGESVVHGAPFKSGVARVARLAGVPIVPAVVWGTAAYSRFVSWLPLKRTRYGVIFGEPIDASDEAEAEGALSQSFQKLYAELRDHGLAAG
jgi:1-acyl-sn-glycerol-3-phosphate acyltransferase